MTKSNTKVVMTAEEAMKRNLTVLKAKMERNNLRTKKEGK